MPPSESLAEGFDLETAYAQLQAHIEAERWIEAIAVCHRILNRQPGYCDVPQLLDGARRQLGSERERSRMAREAWRGTLAPVMDGAQPRRRRPKLALLIGGLAVCLVSAALIVVIPRLWGPLTGVRTTREPAALVESAETPSAPLAVTEMRSFVSSEGQLLLRYPEGWMVNESPSESRPLRIIIITPEARDEPERITIVFAPASGQSAEQVWISGLGFIQSVQDEETEDWLLGEAFSTSVGGYHARQIPFRYTHLPSDTAWQGLITGVVHDSLQYAFIAEAPTSRWSWAWPFFDQVLNSIQFQ